MNIAKTSGPRIDVPERRLLKTYAFDPTSTRLSGRYLTVSIPFETVTPGPRGELLQVVDYDPVREVWYHQVDLNDPFILVQDGLDPTESDPRTHQQVAYAVSMSVIERFERHLGRRFRFRAETQLYLVPHAFEGPNAFFDPMRKAILFGYFKAGSEADLPGQTIFTCLSSDIVAHEVAHAMVHRVRKRFTASTNKDVFAFHEGFSDLVALFQHFAYRDVVFQALTDASGQIDSGGVLFELASEFGVSTGRGGALRKAIDPALRGDPRPLADHFKAATEPHERGACFVAAVFDAFVTRFKAATADLVRIASSGTGELPPGRLHPDLVGRVTDEAVRTADRMLGMVVAALEYLPPIDVTFGDVVRAIVTADRTVDPKGSDGLRGILVEALRKRGIYPTEVGALTDHGLRWPAPRTDLDLNGSMYAAADVFGQAVEELPVNGDFDRPWDRIWQAVAASLLATSAARDRSGDVRAITAALATAVGGSKAKITEDQRHTLTSEDFADRLLKAFWAAGGPPAPIEKLVYSATMDLDLKGEAGHEPEMYERLHAWTRAHATEIGLDPERTIALDGIHVAYRVASDAQPIPEIVIQLFQNGSDLAGQVGEEIGATAEQARQLPINAATTLIARTSGQVKYVIAKPLPFKARPAVDDSVANAFHQQGIERLQRLTEWFKHLDRDDPLSLWEDGPAVLRMDFARLHFDCGAEDLAGGIDHGA